MAASVLGAFAGQFPRPADGLGLPTSLGLGRLLVSSAGFHFPEDALALHLLLEHAKSLVDIVVANENLQRISNLDRPNPRSLRRSLVGR